MKWPAIIIAVLAVALGILLWDRFARGPVSDPEVARMTRKIDSLETVNKGLAARADTNEQRAAAHIAAADTLLDRPASHYLDHAHRLTDTAGLTELARRFWADPFVAAPER